MNALIEIDLIKESNLSFLDFDNLEFGKNISDHMFSIEYINGGWSNAKIGPFSNISLSPATLGLHYGQTVFEGMKAIKMYNGNISIFRIPKHYQRFSRSLDRMCMPVPPFEYFEQGLKELVTIDKNWVPEVDGASLYIRPFMFASEERFGVSISKEFKFIIFTGPVKSYYHKPLKVKVESSFIRASKGGTGFAKCGGNYGGAFYATMLANKEGYDQVIWTDCTDELYIEESGTMNIMFVINGVVVTPALSDTTLDGITRDSYILLAGELGYQVEERKISALELIDAFEKNIVQEAFGCGTAAVSTPIKTINIKGSEYNLPDANEDSFMNKAKIKLTKIRMGLEDDKFSWNTIINT